MTIDTRALFENMPPEKLAAWNKAHVKGFMEYRARQLGIPWQTEPVKPTCPAPVPAQPKKPAPKPSTPRPVVKRVYNPENPYCHRTPRKQGNRTPETQRAEAHIKQLRAEEKPRPNTADIMREFGVKDSWTRLKIAQYYGPAANYDGPRLVVSKQQRDLAAAHIKLQTIRPTVKEIAKEFRISRIYAGQLIRANFIGDQQP